ncbi:hypothetical protein TBLA_0I02990 [Henningerozyma blattae CBS 6284]|uniref:RING-type domain-containing protein n=1 Tax=Henningerozyma blattae (strain ATCC 34711 / CBS 6284 / DSM 70876 / NBRC 10599 / NRRL Y-10934 / UCD 77-7) TaxID=1071380 RepID=I2H9A3_HENB6|nr:hypothetical protein TBLA_0I02990 [Tetrapisispora blattae CBS 6284]CCH62955.1 hypothetical protein TBLA_0I02990 [Tetrapisispora blattae CBS 6284]
MDLFNQPFVFCNICYKKSTKQSPLYITSCAHILCSTHLHVEKINNNTIQNNCLYCDTNNISIIKLDDEKNLPYDILSYFKPFSISNSNLLETFLNVSNFQFNNLINHFSHLQSINSKLNLRLIRQKNLLAEAKISIDQIPILKNEIENLKSKLIEYENLKLKLNEYENLHLNVNLNSMTKMNRPINNPSTTNITTNSSSFFNNTNPIQRSATSSVLSNNRNNNKNINNFFIKKKKPLSTKDRLPVTVDLTMDDDINSTRNIPKQQRRNIQTCNINETFREKFKKNSNKFLNSSNTHSASETSNHSIRSGSSRTTDSNNYRIINDINNKNNNNNNNNNNKNNTSSNTNNNPNFFLNNNNFISESTHIENTNGNSFSPIPTLNINNLPNISPLPSNSNQTTNNNINNNKSINTNNEILMPPALQNLKLTRRSNTLNSIQNMTNSSQLINNYANNRRNTWNKNNNLLTRKRLGSSRIPDLYSSRDLLISTSNVNIKNSRTNENNNTNQFSKNSIQNGISSKQRANNIKNNPSTNKNAKYTRIR